MTLADKLNMYLSKKRDAISLIRQLSGMFDPKHAIKIMTLICAITRYEQGDLDEKTFRSVWKIPTKEEMMFEEGADYPKQYNDLGIGDLREELIKLIHTEEKMCDIRDGNLEGLKVDENGITVETDLVAIAHDISLLTTYITYRVKKEQGEI